MSQPYSPPILITSSEIQARISELAQQIYQDYLIKGGSLTLICILKGGYLFCSDLSREISRISQSHAGSTTSHTSNLEIEFISAKSYEGTTSALEHGGELRIELDTRQPIEGKHVLIVEDIVDTGLSMEELRNRLKARNPASLRLCTLLSKPSRRAVGVDIEYCGFDIEDKFVIGYGMDYKEKYRELPYIGYL